MVGYLATNGRLFSDQWSGGCLPGSRGGRELCSRDTRLGRLAVQRPLGGCSSYVPHCDRGGPDLGESCNQGRPAANRACQLDIRFDSRHCRRTLRTAASLPLHGRSRHIRYRIHQGMRRWRSYFERSVESSLWIRPTALPTTQLIANDSSPKSFRASRRTYGKWFVDSNEKRCMPSGRQLALYVFSTADPPRYTQSSRPY
jgi:hypothetical protein